MKNSTIYIRTLKHAEHTVFCVADGQKNYYDPLSKRSVPYSSGQQVKHSLILSLCDALNEMPSPVTFISDVNKKKEIKEGEVFGTCDPSYSDQLLGGWMNAGKGGENKILKRRSPLSISAMRALHPMLAAINGENLSFDRSNRGNTIVVVRDEDGVQLTDDQISDLLHGTSRSLSRKWIQDNKRAVGLFVQDIAIDLVRLFTITINDLEPEVSKDTEEKLRAEGWKEVNTVYGKSLLAPKEYRERVIPALAHAILNWKIQSNQSRTFSLMETLAVGISGNANHIAAAIRPKLSDLEENKVMPIVEEGLSTVDMFVTLPAEGYIACNTASLDAIEQAEAKLIHLMQSYNYEN